MRNNFSVHQKSIQPQFMNQSMNVPRDDLRASQVNQGNQSQAFKVQPQIQQPIRVIQQQQKIVLENPQFIQNNGVVRVQNSQIIQNKDVQNAQYFQQMILLRENQIQQLNQSLSQIAQKFNEVHEQLKTQQKGKPCIKCADFDQLQFQIQQERLIHQEKLAQNQNEIQKLKKIIESSEQEIDILRLKTNENQQQVQSIQRKISDSEQYIQKKKQPDNNIQLEENLQQLSYQITEILKD